MPCYPPNLFLLDISKVPFIFRPGNVSSGDWQVSSVVMSCVLFLDEIPVKNLSPPAILTFNITVSTSLFSSNVAYLLEFYKLDCYELRWETDKFITP